MPESYLVEVKPSVFAETSLTESDFDAVSNMSLSAGEVDDNIRMEFLSRDGAEEWIEQLHPESKSRRGSLLLRRSHGNDESDVDAYLVFQPQ
jgi:hypothetical protein